MRDELVRFALHRSALFSAENFSGDALVAEYREFVTEYFGVSAEVLVAWRCPPDVSVLRIGHDNLIVRSERLDGLLIDCWQLREIHRFFGPDLADSVVLAAILRWMAEFLIGYNQPALAVAAMSARPQLPGLKLPNLHVPFRDEALASVSATKRVAIQSFCLGHEFGHLTRGRRENVDLRINVDGLPMIDHLTFDLRASGASAVELEQHIERATKILDPVLLLEEIEADVFATETVANFLVAGLDVDLRDAMEAVLGAFDMQLHVYDIKEACHQLAALAGGTIDRTQFDTALEVAELTSVARGRSVVRRLGILWTLIDAGRKSIKPDFNAFVAKMDEMIIRSTEWRERMRRQTDVAVELLRQLLNREGGLGEFAEFEAILDRDRDLRLELYFILIAFGCSGAVDVESYLRAAEAHSYNPSTTD